MAVLQLFEPTSDADRRVIVATIIVGASLTGKHHRCAPLDLCSNPAVDGTLFVVDAGYFESEVYNPMACMDALQIMPLS